KEEALLKSACGAGDAVACLELARPGRSRQKAEKAVASAYEKAIALLRDACEVGVAGHCDELGQLHERGEGTPRNPKKAKELYERACELDHPAGCFDLARQYALGESVEGASLKKDPGRALSLLVKACDRGNADGCRGAADALDDD